MGEKIHDENGRMSNFEGLVTLTLTLDRVIRHTIVHYSWTLSAHQISSEWRKLFVDIRMEGRTYVRTSYVWINGQTSRPALLGQLRGVDLKTASNILSVDKQHKTAKINKNKHDYRVFADRRG